jgi:methyl-accepting chemotaxis protein
MTVSTNPTYSYNQSPNYQSGIAYDFSPFFDRMATALETIATNSTTIATKISEIDTNTANMATYIHSLQTDLDTIAANSTIMAKLAQGYTELITNISATGGASGQKVISTLSSTSAIT